MEYCNSSALTPKHEPNIAAGHWVLFIETEAKWYQSTERIPLQQEEASPGSSMVSALLASNNDHK